MEEQIGTRVITQLGVGGALGDYEIESIAGEGGMGVVYRAKQLSLGRAVALKVIRGEIAQEPEYHDRFLREATLAAAVDHPNVVPVYDVGEDDGRLWLAMQWIDGKDLGSLIASYGPRLPDRAVAIATQLARALDAVHAAGLVHRDVKPGNVLIRDVDQKDHAYLTDFGVAKPALHGADQLTRTGSVVGTTGYLSPEQIRGGEPGPRSDLYALACVFVETLTGQQPFTGDNELAVRWAHANDPRPRISDVRPDIGDRYDAFIARALAVDPTKRFKSGREFAEALQAVHAGSTTSILPAGIPHTPTAVGPPTPLLPYTPLPPSGAQTPSPQIATPVYMTPPGYEPRSRRGSPLALILLALVAFAGIAVGALAATGVLSNPRSVTTPAASVRPHKIKPHANPGGSTHTSSHSSPRTSPQRSPSPSPPPGAASALSEYWSAVAGGHYDRAFSLSTGRVASSSPPSVFESERPEINVLSIGQAAPTGSGSAQVPIDFYAEDTTGSDAGTCRHFAGDATMEFASGSWLYASNNYSASVVNGNPNCPGGSTPAPPSAPAPSAPSDSGAAAALSAYWTAVGSGHYNLAYSLSTGQVASSSPPSVFRSERPGINVLSIGQPVPSGSGSAQVPIEFYAEDTAGSDAGTCRHFTGNATMERAGAVWLYAANNYSGSVANGDPNCPGG
jgi:serine/threonine-protein kinase